MRRIFATITASLMLIRIVLAAAVMCAILGLVLISGIVQDESGRPISPFVVDPAKILFFGLIIIGIGVLLWVPLSALICARIAHNRGWSTRRYAIAGAAYSMLFFFPGLYFIMQMCNKTVWKPAVVAAYALLYAGWFLGPILVTLAITGLSAGTSGAGSLLSVLLISLSLAMILAWCISLFRLLNRNSPSSHQAATVETGQAVDSLIADVYLAPFVLCFSSIVVLLLAGLLATWSPF